MAGCGKGVYRRKLRGYIKTTRQEVSVKKLFLPAKTNEIAPGGICPVCRDGDLVEHTRGGKRERDQGSGMTGMLLSSIHILAACPAARIQFIQILRMGCEVPLPGGPWYAFSVNRRRRHGAGFARMRRLSDTGDRGASGRRLRVGVDRGDKQPASSQQAVRVCVVVEQPSVCFVGWTAP